MSEATPIPVVFDCTVFAQALINPKGPAGACLSAAQQNRLRLFISNYVIQEIRELPTKLPPRLGVTDERIEALIIDL
jgi:predicted nucleic acid-binding protein